MRVGWRILLIILTLVSMEVFYWVSVMRHHSPFTTISVFGFYNNREVFALAGNDVQVTEWLAATGETKGLMQFCNNLFIILVMEVVSVLVCLMMINRDSTLLENLKQKAGRELAICFAVVFVTSVRSDA